MDVWWLWLDPPHSITGFQQVIHRWTFLLISKQPRDTLNLVRMTKTQQETAWSLASTTLFSLLLHFLLLFFFAWKETTVFCMTLNLICESEREALRALLL